jgi:hypothetical protein
MESRVSLPQLFPSASGLLKTISKQPWLVKTKGATRTAFVLESDKSTFGKSHMGKSRANHGLTNAIDLSNIPSVSKGPVRCCGRRKGFFLRFSNPMSEQQIPERPLSYYN